MIVDRIINLAIEYDVIAKEEERIYHVAITSLFFSAITWGTLLVFSIYFQKQLPSLVFLLFHIPLRVFAGGFHQPTRTRCYIQSLVMFTVLMFGATSQLYYWVVNHCIIILPFSVAIFVLSPVAASNKPLSDKEYSRYRFTTRIILVLELACMFFFKMLEMNDFLYFAAISTVIVSIQVIIAKKPSLLKYEA